MPVRIHTVFTIVCYYRYNEREGELPMNSIRRFKNLLSILMLYASRLVVNNSDLSQLSYKSDLRPDRIITARVFPRLTTDGKH